MSCNGWPKLSGGRDARLLTRSLTRSAHQLPRLINGKPIQLDAVPTLELDDFRETVFREAAGGGRLSALFGQPQPSGQVRLWAVLAQDNRATLTAFSTLAGDRYPALTSSSFPRRTGSSARLPSSGVSCPRGIPG